MNIRILVTVLFVSLGSSVMAQSSMSADTCNAVIITPSQEICTSSFELVAQSLETGQTGVWDGPANTSFSDINATTTTLSNLSQGPNTITWTVFDAFNLPCDVAEVVIINSQVLTVPIIDTPNNQEVCSRDGFQVEAWEGYPLLPGEVGIWSSDQVQVTFSNINALTTIANNLAPGVNRIFWNITNGSCEGSPASITVTNNEVVTQAEIETDSIIKSCVLNGFSDVTANTINPIIQGEIGTWHALYPAMVTFSPNSEMPIINGLMPGENLLVWTISRGNCPTNSDSVIIATNVSTPPEIISVDSGTPTCGQNDGFIYVSVESGTPPYEYSIDNGNNYQASEMFDDINQGFYLIKVRDDNNCKDADSLSVINTGIPTVDIVPVNPDCGDNNGLLTVNVDGGIPPYSFEWDIPDISNDSIVLNLPVGNYTVTLTDNVGCEVTASQELVAPPPVIDLGEDMIRCSVDTILQVPYSNVIWSTGGTDSLISINEFDTYYVTVTDGNCSVIDSITFSILAPITISPMEDTTIFKGTSIEFAITGADALDVTSPQDWTSTICNNPVLTPSETGSYVMSATNQEGCSESVSFTVTVIDERPEAYIFIPDAITPNGDGYNDELVIPLLDNYPNNTLTIFNRHGDTMVSGTYGLGNLTESCDGTVHTFPSFTFDGSNWLAGAYYYVLELGDELNTVIKGRFFIFH